MGHKKFQLLIVEDEEDIVDFIKSIFTQIFSENIDFTIATNRDAAFLMLEEPDVFFDYVTVDLRIPTQNGLLDQNPQNGLAVLGRCSEVISGTPVRVLTGTSTIEMINGFIKSSHKACLWGGKKEETTFSHMNKSELDNLALVAQEIYDNFMSIQNVEILADTVLPIEHDRLIRIFTSQQNAVKVKVNPVGGGYSVAKVYSITLIDIYGNEIISAIAKCGPTEKIIEDSHNFDRAVVRLVPEATPRKMAEIRFGAATCSAVFYGFATGYVDSFFSVSSKKLITKEILNSIQYLLSPWHNNKSGVEEITIKELRRTLVSDDDTEIIMDKYNLEIIKKFEEHRIRYYKSYQHGDLHGENILINSISQSAVLIDYGDVSENISILDPLTLECSFLFHDKAAKYPWPQQYHLLNWNDLEEYTKDCPIKSEIEFCRNWAHSLRLDKKDMSACLYSYALRQLKYPDTNKEMALSLIRVAIKMLTEE